MPSFSRKYLILLALIGALVPSVSSAQSTMYEGDKQRKMKEDIEAIFGIYILNPSRRHPEEKVSLKKARGGVTVEMNLFYDQRRPAADRVKCFGFRWLLLGRFGDGGGARTLFSRYPKVQNVDIIFYTLTSKRTVDRDGKYTVTKEPKRFLKARISRQKAKTINWKSLEKSLSIDGKRCREAGEKAVVNKWYGEYLGKPRK